MTYFINRELLLINLKVKAETPEQLCSLCSIFIPTKNILGEEKTLIKVYYISYVPFDERGMLLFSG